MGNMGFDLTSMIGQFGEPLKNAATALKAAQDKAMSTSQELNLKMLELAKQNTTSTLEALKSLASATDVSEAIRLQQAFMRDSAAAGMAQIREMSDMFARAGREAFAPMTQTMAPAAAA